MASPCEVLVESDDAAQAKALITLAQQEAIRIEQKFSRYRDDNIIHQINQGGEPVTVDPETARLLDFAQHCYSLSEGWFDVTSGILRRAWDFGQNETIPSQQEIKSLLPGIGWDKVEWEKPRLTVPMGMEIDLGGIGKEYAVDCCAALVNALDASPSLVNFGGDLAATKAPRRRSYWNVAIDSVRAGVASDMIDLKQGALATSGDARRFLMKDGSRYGHILDPTSGWPVPDAPRSITVAADTCVQAGMISTLAILKGAGAETFLDGEGVTFWCRR